ncbi:Por secretion system C-terminal sorting domain-containing protein [Flaviramulus basaltis]|uniref:Por secretion system C-terminal sorting domain-containing protein n=1 Tax=Flaviramulus basaltis TaxID=369401 RepID=A0A1K2IN18_9FLAO|nr:T9SS type A sorting domain-containing protein [Flaviramulus basaltis]SFZ93600.1 Por secretion system C-terminal sorting domain-containing protein [Flaviramulus basaltis]
MKTKLFFFTLLCLSIKLTAQTTYYVDQTATGANTGLTWNDAFTSLNIAFGTASMPGDKIYITEDTYTITTGITITIDIEIYGGYSAISDTQTGYTTFDANGSTGFSIITTTELTNAALFDHLILTNADNSAGLGGGMLNNTGGAGSSPRLSYVTFLNNTASRGGGLCNLTGSAILDNVIFDGNTALHSTTGGGAIYNSASSPTISNTSFINNASVDGAGIFNNTSSSPVIDNCFFNNNKASRSGGGIYNRGTANPIISNSTFSNNDASSGGGIFNVTADNKPIITNVLFIENTANNGAGLYNNASGPSPTLINVTFYGNIAISSGGGMRSDGSSNPLLYNTVFFNNTNDTTGNVDDIVGSIDASSSNNASDKATISASTNFVELSALPGSDLFSNDTDPNGPDDTFGTSDDGLIPASTSILVNAGDNSKNTTPATDMTGQNRISDTTIDLGAYEYQSTLSTNDILLKTSISLYPNPSTGLVNILVKNKQEKSQISVYDINGRTLLNKNLNNKSIDLSSFANGIYLIKINTNSGTVVKRILKE